MPNLDNLRKQAKLYLRWHRDGDYTVAAQIREFLPRYRHLNDRQVLEQSFKLSDAQELVARKTGFDSWIALRKGIESMTAQSSPQSSAPTLLLAEPQLYVSDIAAATEFYTRKLGFEVLRSYGEPVFWAQVARDGVRLNLRHVDGPVFDAVFLANEHNVLAASIVLNDAKALFLEYQERGVVFHQGLKTEPWGSRTFIVADPDANLILFADGGAQAAGEDNT